MSLKLRVELIPETAWFSSLYRLIPSEVWKSIRAERIKTAGAKCEICGSSVKPLCLHEVWGYDEQYFFLKEKVLELQKRNQNASAVSIIRNLIDKDRKEWAKDKKARRGVS